MSNINTANININKIRN